MNMQNTELLDSETSLYSLKKLDTSHTQVKSM